MNDTPQDFWNQRYLADGFLFGRQPNAFVKSQAHLFKQDQNVLSIADGEGRNGVFVARQGARVTSVEFSQAAQQKARGLADEFGVDISFELADIFEWSGDQGGYDIVLAIFVQFAPPDKRTLLFDKIKSWVKLGGLVVMQGYRPQQVSYKTGGPPHAENMYTSDILRLAFGEFEMLHMHEHDSEVDEGSGHSGMSALIDMIARRVG